MDRVIFYNALRVSKLFNGKLSSGQVKGMEGIFDAFETAGDGREKTLAYCLATARHEVGAGMVPVREGFKATHAAAAAYVKRQGYAYAVPVGGQVYYGRGYVQLTWQKNYAACSADAGVDLVANPDAALDPVIGARLLCLGIIDGRWNARGRGIAHYLPTVGDDDLKNARRTVNVTDRWVIVAGYYHVFLEAIRQAGAWTFEPPRPPGEVARLQPSGDDAARLDWIEEGRRIHSALGDWLGRAPPA
jgi:hypothetical protein